MRWWKRRRQRRNNQAKEIEAGELREFVYLDEVSVTSLLSSVLGKIPSEFQDTSGTTVKAEVNSNIGANTPIAKASVGSRIEAGRSEDTR